MRTLRAFLIRLTGLLNGRASSEEDFSAELESHLALHTEEGVRGGLSAQEARRQALIALGGAEQAHQAYRERRTLPWVGNLRGDLLYAVRTLRRSPGFTATALLILALGIGATTAVFSLVDSVLLQPLHYHQPGRLVTIWEAAKYLQLDQPYVEANARHEEYWKRRATAFSDITLLREGTAGIAQLNEHPRIVGVVSSYTNLFSVLGVQPEFGRAFLPEEGTSGHEGVAILTHALWQQMFAGQSQVQGKSIRLNGNLLQVVGVLPDGFRFPKGNELSSQTAAGRAWPTVGVFVPMVIDEGQRSLDGDYNFVALGRLRNGVSLQQATSQLNTIDGAILHDIATETKTDVEPDGLRVYLQPMQETVVTSSRVMLWLLLASVCAVLLIACVNLANLQLARAVSREKELSVRTALGAPAYRLVWTTLCESLLLAGVGGLAGLLLAQSAIRLFVRYAPVDLPRLDEVGVHPGVLVFSLALSVLTGVVFGALPALKALHVDPQTALAQGGARASGDLNATRTRKWLIGIEVCAATGLLMVMGLLDQSLLHLLNQRRGFSTSHVFSIEVDVDGKPYQEDASRTAFDDEVLRRLRQLPGVASVGLVSAMPLNGEHWVDALARTDRPDTDAHPSNFRWISPDYLATMSISLIQGRMLLDSDRRLKTDAQPALISERTAKTLWPSQDPLGKQLRRGGKSTYTVVGVVADTRSNSLKQQPGLMVYLPFWDNPPYPTFFMVRTDQNSSSIEDALRRQIWSYDPDANIPQVRSLDEQVNESLSLERSQVVVLTSFGAAALLLSVLGIYGVLSYTVARRAKELGIRMALGASRQAIYRLTMTEAAGPVIFGLMGGVVFSFFAGYFIRSLLYGVPPVNLTVTVTVVISFLLVAALAAFVPARRAVSIDPMRTLRIE